MKFFKILTLDFKTQLNLPPRFCAKKRRHFSGEAVIVSRLGRWKIKAGNERGRFYFHGKEWVKFVNRHELEEGYFVVFEHHPSFVFHASIFDATACEKLEYFQPNSHDETEPHRRGTNPTPLRSCANPTFSRILRAGSGCDVKNKDISRLYLPRKIWRAENLEQKREAILRISGLETMEWKAKLAFYPGAEPRFLIKQGWYEFVTANGIKKGHNCAFEIIKDASHEFGYPKEFIIIIVTNSH